jgi:hypothetical protein
MHAAQQSQSVSSNVEKIRTIRPLFELGQVVGTRAFVDLFPHEGQRANAVNLIMKKYHFGDWGTVSKTSQKQNEEALNEGNPARIFAKYTIKAQSGKYVEIFVITEHDRSVTTLMLPSDY